jgi:hypothetical protein
MLRLSGQFNGVRKLEQERKKKKEKKLLKDLNADLHLRNFQ